MSGWRQTSNGAFLLVFLFGCSSGTGPQGGPSGNSRDGGSPSTGNYSSACGARVSDPPGPTKDPYCPSIDEMTAWIVGPPECPDQVYPTERELGCNATRYPRKTMGTGLVNADLDWEIEMRPDAAENYKKMGDTRWVLDIADELDEMGLPRDYTTPSVTGLPPHFEFKGPNGTVDFVTERETFETSVRVYAAEVLRRRAKGQIVIFSYGLGPHEPQPPTNPADIDSVIQSVIVPRTAIVSRMAELVQAEGLCPFGGEADILANAPGVKDLPAEQRLAFVQKYVDAVRDTSKKYFTGKIIGASAWQYYPVNDGFWSTAPMDQVDWRGFDAVQFTVLPVNFNHCSVEFADAHMKAQLAKIQEITQRDGVAWGIGELDIFTFGYLSEYTPERGCVESKKDVFFPIWDATLKNITDVPTRPLSIALMTGPSEWTGDKTIENGIKERFVKFATDLKK